MVANAPTESLRKSYEALGHFITAWQFYYTTMQVGDIPFSEAVKGESDDIIKPKYDEQKAIFLGIINALDKANQLFAEGSNFSGDLIYNGDVLKWRRLVNSFQLHVLLQLYRKTGDVDLKVANRFAEVAARPLMQGYADNFALTYTATAGQNYPWSDVPAGSGNSFVKSNYTMLSANLIDPLKALQDRRLFHFATPSAVKVNGGLSQSDYNAYVGAEVSDNYSVLEIKKQSKDYSDINLRYVQLVNAEPVCLFSYWDTQFALAEAAVRGWISGTQAQTYYANGITSSMSFVANYTPDNETYHHNMKMDAAYIQAYPATTGVALSGTDEQKIAQIIMQKYLANFFHRPNFDSWFENRRTGYPVFKLNSATNLNVPTTAFPLRWQYPSAEISYNSNNLNAALTRQYSGVDDFNSPMWILK